MLIGLLSLAYQSHDNCVFLQSLLSTPVLLTHCFTALQKASQHVLNEDKTGIDAARLHYIACDNSHQSQRFDGRKLRLPVHLPTEPEAEGHQCVLGLAHSFILVHLLDASRRFAEEPQTCMSH